MKRYIFFLFFSIVTVCLSAQTAQTTPTPMEKTVDLNDYIGTYKFSNYFDKGVIEVKDNALFAEIDTNGQNKLLKDAEKDTFKSTSSYGTIFIFKRDETSKVTQVTLKLMGEELTGEKQ